MAGVTSEKKVLHIVSGGHTDAVTGKDCHWNVFRVRNTTTMDVNAIADTLIEKFGKKWYFHTPDYAYVLDDGAIVHQGPARELANDEARVQALTGASAEDWSATKPG